MQTILIPLAVFLASRIYTTFALAHAGDGQVLRPDQSNGYWGIVTNWDGEWYQRIAAEGYPTDLPTDSAGRVTENAWAFLPGFPMLARALMALTGAGFPMAASLVSMTCAAVAVVVLYHLVLRTGGPSLALVAVVGLSVYPATAILQISYAESVELLIIVLALWSLHRRAYGWLPLIAMSLALTRQVMPALALTFALHLMLRVGSRRRDPLRRGEVLILAGSTGLAAVLTGLWPAIAGLATGVPSAYLQTYAAWNRDGSPVGVTGSWVGKAIAGEGLALTTAAIALYILISVLRPWAWTLGNEVRSWSLAYGTYILMITPPGPSVLRYLMLVLAALPPLPLVPDPKDLNRWRAPYWLACGLIVAASLVAQWAWVHGTLARTVQPQLWP